MATSGFNEKFCFGRTFTWMLGTLIFMYSGGLFPIDGMSNVCSVAGAGINGSGLIGLRRES